MILGIGIDTVSVNRIKELISKFDEKFENKIFTEAEIIKAQNRKNLSLQALFTLKDLLPKRLFQKLLGLELAEESILETLKLTMTK